MGRLMPSKEGLVVVMESSDGLYSSIGISGEGDESAFVRSICVLSGDVDERMKDGRVRESKELPARVISRDARPNPFSVGNRPEVERESNELRPNVADGLEGVGVEAESCVPPSFERTPSMTCRKVRVAGFGEESLVRRCLPNTFAALEVDKEEEDVGGLNNLVV